MRGAAGLLLLTALLPLMGQEPAFMEAATHPGRGQHYSRLFWVDGGAALKHAFGFSADLALLPDLTLDRHGVTGADLRLKQRILRRDTGPVDTWRMSVTGGLSWREGRDPGPRVGVASTTIRGRHGVNAQVDLNAADTAAGRFAVNASHLYRIYPARFSAQTTGAWYTMLESLNDVSPDAEVQANVAAGLLYEARRWAAEVSVRAGDSPTRVGLGLRWLW